MGRSLVIVESPAKAKTLGKYLGSNFDVRASFGHVRDLPTNRLGVDIENGFKPEYEIIERSKKIVADLRKRAEEVDAVYLASDPDREGEAIAWHLYVLLKGKQKNIKRIEFQEVTKKAVQEAVANPHDINMNRVNAQQARRILDRLVGYQVSPILWEKIQGGLSAGRVQTVALRLICEREEEIEKFKPEDYFTVNAKLRSNRDKEKVIDAQLVQWKDKKIKEQDIKKKELAEAIVSNLEGNKWIVQSVQKKEREKKPPAVFTTSTLQQEASTKLNMSSKKTMTIAQQLYEGIDIGEETTGLITYMRTDSVNIAEEALDAVRKFIKENLGADKLPDKPIVHETKNKTAQEAHEGIRPTNVFRTPEKIKKYLNEDQFKLYELIWKRFVASQMKPAKMEGVQINIEAGNALFRAAGSTIVDRGFLEVYDYMETKETFLPPVQVGDELELLKLSIEEHQTKPPERYTEAKLIKELEEKGIGRPSTYASIIQTLAERQPYVEIVKKHFVPTQTGRLVCQELIKAFPDLFDVNFTSNMEESLDKISNGNENWITVLEKFYKDFSKQIEKAKQMMKKVEIPQADFKCPKCGQDVYTKEGKFGKYYSCSAYPNCDYRESVKKKTGLQYSDESCPECGELLVIREGSKGKFIGCSGFPKCKYVKPLDEDGTTENRKECPECGKPMRLITSKTGKFWGCTGYPDCRKTLPEDDLGVCPECGKPLVKRQAKANKKTFVGCSGYPNCTYIKETAKRRAK